MESKLGLQVTLAPQAQILEAQEAFALPIKVSVHNAADSTVTILRWGTPLDPQAGVLGIFEICDTTDKRKLPVPTIMVSRKLPASEDDLVEIQARHTIDVTVNLPIQSLDKGHEYSVRAQGTWHAVWPTELSNVTTSQLRDNEGAYRGDFISNESSVSIGLEKDARAVFEVLKRGGIAIIPMSVGYGITAIDPDALNRIFRVKRREPHKRHEMVGSYYLHRDIHVLPPQEASIVKLLTVDLELPLGIVAPYRLDHPIIRKLPPDILAQSVVGDTLAMLVNGGALLEELSRLAALEELPLMGSSANITGKGTKTVVEDIEPEILEVADIVIDYGRQKFHHPRASSTIIDFRTIKVVRYGACYDVVQDALSRFYGIKVPDDPWNVEYFV
ncbi:hypothetical protein PEXP_054040 [Penicillium expansum]|nr:hypothetical protein PEXP_054040 [Penicillium expansum]